MLQKEKMMNINNKTMKTLDEVIKAIKICDSAIDDCKSCAYFSEDCENLRPLREDILEYLERYKADCQKRCKNCINWDGNPNNKYEEYFCGYETWTYADDWCSKWEEKL